LLAWEMLGRHMHQPDIMLGLERLISWQNITKSSGKLRNNMLAQLLSIRI
jgi:hypothetical protein